MKYTHILKASKSAAIDWVAKGLPVSTEGHILSASEMDNIESALATGEKASADFAAEQTARVNAEAAKTTAESALATANSSITKLNEQIIALKAEDGKPLSTTGEQEKDKFTPKTEGNEFRTAYDDELDKMLALDKANGR